MTRLRWAIIGVLVILAYMLGYLLMFDREVPYEKPPKLTADEAKECAKLRPGRDWTLRTETTRACWTINTSRTEVCYRRG